MRELEAKKIRNWILYPYFITYFIVVSGSNLNFSIGLPLIICGLLLRFYASGFIQKSKALATSGPYSYIRHPLYAGSFLIGMGLSAISNNYYLVAFFIFAFLLTHIETVKNEDRYLEQKFGPKFENYKGRVPAFFPNFLPFHSKPKVRFNFKLAVINGEIVRMFGITLLVFFLYLIEEFTFRKAILGIRQFILIWWFILFLAFLLVNLNIRKRFIANHLDKMHQ